MLNLVRSKSIFFSSLYSNSKNYLSSNIKSNNGFTSSKRCLTPIDFIKDKNKFYIPTFFDRKETKKFLESKEIALMEMKLDDEVTSIDSKCGDDTNDTFKINKSIKSEVKKHKFGSPRKYKEKNTVQKVKKKQTYSPDIISKKNNKKMRKNKDFESIKGFESDSNSENDSLDLYKLIMDNVDDSDDKLYQKYKLAKVKTKIAQSKKNFSKVNNSKNNNINDSDRTFKSRKKTKNKKMQNFVDLSKETKNLTTFSGKEISSIDEENYFEDKNESKFISNLNSSKKRDNNILTNNIDYKIDINSDNHSLVSLLSELL